jgi:hypothetical protein
VPDLEAFGNETGKRGALGRVIALAFDEGVREEIEALGLKPLDRNGLLRIVGLWDPLKAYGGTVACLLRAACREKFISRRPAQGVPETGGGSGEKNGHAG